LNAFLAPIRLCLSSVYISEQIITKTLYSVLRSLKSPMIIKHNQNSSEVIYSAVRDILHSSLTYDEEVTLGVDD